MSNRDASDAAKITAKRKKRSWETDERGKAIPQDHHVVPKSRGGEHTKENMLCNVPSDVHWAYHHLFGNLTPIEIIATLLRYFFHRGNFRVRYQRIVKRGGSLRVNPDKLLLSVLKTFPEDWVPSEEVIQRLQERRQQRLPTLETSEESC
jgi:hypothetical protein